MDYATATELGTYDMWQVHRERTKLAKFYMDRWNSCEGLDAILSMIILFLVSYYQVTTLILYPRPDYPLYFCETWRLEACWVRLVIAL